MNLGLKSRNSWEVIFMLFKFQDIIHFFKTIAIHVVYFRQFVKKKFSVVLNDFAIFLFAVSARLDRCLR